MLPTHSNLWDNKMNDTDNESQFWVLDYTSDEWQTFRGFRPEDN